jgi:hypothetical protein
MGNLGFRRFVVKYGGFAVFAMGVLNIIGSVYVLHKDAYVAILGLITGMLLIVVVITETT